MPTPRMVTETLSQIDNLRQTCIKYMFIILHLFGVAMKNQD